MNKKSGRFWLILAALLLVSLIAVSCAPTPAPTPVTPAPTPVTPAPTPAPTPVEKPAEQELLIFGTTSTSSGYYPVEVAYCTLINKYVPEVKLTPIETGATLDNMRRLLRNEIHMGFSSCSVDLQVTLGEGPFEGQPPVTDLVRTGWMDCLTTFNFVVRADSGINTIYDLAGKKFNVGLAGSTSEELCEWALKLLGVWDTIAVIERGTTADAIAAMQDGRVDGWQKGAANPDSAIMQVQATTDIKILPFSEEDLAKLSADRGFILPGKIPADIYPGVPETPTYGMYLGANMRADIPQELQYKMVKALLEHWDEYLTIIPRYKVFEDPHIWTTEKTVIPLSAGTVQYLKEKGYTVPEHLIPPEYKE